MGRIIIADPMQARATFGGSVQVTPAKTESLTPEQAMQGAVLGEKASRPVIAGLYRAGEAIYDAATSPADTPLQTTRQAAALAMGGTGVTPAGAPTPSSVTFTPDVQPAQLRQAAAGLDWSGTRTNREPVLPAWQSAGGVAFGPASEQGAFGHEVAGLADRVTQDDATWQREVDAAFGPSPIPSPRPTPEFLQAIQQQLQATTPGAAASPAPAATPPIATPATPASTTDASGTWPKAVRAPDGTFHYVNQDGSEWRGDPQAAAGTPAKTPAPRLFVYEPGKRYDYNTLLSLAGDIRDRGAEADRADLRKALREGIVRGILPTEGLSDLFTGAHRTRAIQEIDKTVGSGRNDLDTAYKLSQIRANNARAEGTEIRNEYLAEQERAKSDAMVADAIRKGAVAAVEPQRLAAQIAKIAASTGLDQIRATEIALLLNSKDAALRARAFRDFATGNYMNMIGPTVAFKNVAQAGQAMRSPVMPPAYGSDGFTKQRATELLRQLEEEKQALARAGAEAGQPVPDRFDVLDATGLQKASAHVAAIMGAKAEAGHKAKAALDNVVRLQQEIQALGLTWDAATRKWSGMPAATPGEVPAYEWTPEQQALLTGAGLPIPGMGGDEPAPASPAPRRPTQQPARQPSKPPATSGDLKRRPGETLAQYRARTGR